MIVLFMSINTMFSIVRGAKKKYRENVSLLGLGAVLISYKSGRNTKHPMIIAEIVKNILNPSAF